MYLTNKRKATTTGFKININGMFMYLINKRKATTTKREVNNHIIFA